MKKYILTFLTLAPMIIVAQVGIRTQKPQQIFHIDVATNNPTDNTAPSPAQAEDDFVVTKDGRVGVGVINPAVRFDIRSNSSENAIGIGTTAQTAAQAKGGAIQYHESGTSWGLSYSDGTNWHFLPTSSVKALVYAGKSSAQTFANGTIANVTNWNVLIDRTNSFDPTTGVFTAPNDGEYIVSVNIVTQSGSISNNSNTETILTYTATNGIPEFRCVNAYPGYGTGTGSNRTGNNCTAIFQLKKNETIRPRFLQNFNSSINSTTNQADNSITITQL